MGDISTDYPWTLRPLIANAPMAGFAGPRLATAVTEAGGLGFIGSVDDMELLSTKLDEAAATLAGSEIKTAGKTLPVGVGFLLFAAKLESAAAVIAKHRPAAVFLSCPRETQDLASWANAMRAASPESRVWIQVPSVTAAVEVARLCAPDVLVLQAADAGGHGGSPGAGLITLVPETRDALDASGFDIPVVGAGGISDGRGVAAALTCGAEGVMLGTAFLVSHEVDLPVKEYQESILKARDGGNSTVRAIVFDELRGPNIWPAGYDGRALVNTSFKDHSNGVTVDELRKRYAEAAQRPDKGYGDEQRAAVWAGSGVGLLNEVKAAKDIVNQLIEGAKNTLDKCTYSQRVKERVYGQSVVDRLETRIRHLEAANRRLQAAKSPAADVGSSDAEVDGTSQTRGAAVAQEVAFLSTSVAGDKLFLGPTSGILFAGLVQSGVVDDDGSEPEHVRSPTAQSWNPEDKEDDLPPERLARELVDAYLAHDHITYPFLHPAAIHAAVDCMYHSTPADRLRSHAFEAFMFNMILAIASSQASKLNWHAFPGAHTHHQRATRYLNRVLCHGGVRALQAMLLLCQFQLTNSTRESSASLWHIVGISARMCLELGLHREALYQTNAAPPAQDSSSIPINFEDSLVRRLCFWSVFALDRVVSVTLGRPLAICREDIDVEMPQLDTVDTATPSSIGGIREASSSYHNSSIALFIHIVRYRDFCGRCLTTLHRGGKQSTQTEADRHQLRDDLASELQTWRADTQQLGLFEMDLSTPLAEARSSFRCAAWYELLYHNGVLLLYRPSYATMSGIKDDANLHILTAAKQSITLYSYLFRSRKINFSWMVLHAVFLSGLSYIYALSGLFRAMRRPSASRQGIVAQISGVPGLVDIINDCRACSNVLVAVSERCNSQKNCHEVFDRLSDALVKDAVQATSAAQYGPPSTHSSLPIDHTQAASFNTDAEQMTASDSTQLPVASGSADAALRECFPDLQVMYDAQWYDDGIRQIGTDWFNETLGGIEYPAADWSMTS